MKYRIRELRESLTDEKGKKYSQTKFAEIMNVTRDVISNYEMGRVEPSPVFIDLLCTKFGINEDWLRTGSGEMFKKKWKSETSAEISAQLYGLDETSFKYRLLAALAKATPEQLDVIEKLVDDIAKGGE